MRSSSIRVVVWAGALFSIMFAARALEASQSFDFEDHSAGIPVEPDADTTDTGGVALGDIDADGDLDLFLAEGTAGLAPRQNRLYINDGSGAFGDETGSRIPSLPQVSTDAEIADLDGDGDLDIFVANVGRKQLLLNDGTGHFTDASAANLPPGRPIFEDISVDVELADVDGDGDLDALLANELPVPGFSGSQSRVYINDGTAHFADETAARFPVAFEQTAGFGAGDIDGDGDLDLILANNGLERVLINNGLGFFTNETAARLPPIADSSREAALGDIDGDGDLDLFVAASRLQQSRLYFNNGSGVFFDATAGALPASIVRATAAVFHDFDSDGDLDIYLALTGEAAGTDPIHGFLGEQNRYYVNNGRGGFRDKTAQHFPAVSDPSFSVDVGDIDGDGRDDLIVGNSGASGAEKLYLWRHRGNGH